jgi:hypothetical protein
MEWGWVYLVRRPLTGLFYHPLMIDDDDECGTVGGMRISRGNRGTRRKPVPVPLCPPQIPQDLTWARSRAAAEGSRRLTGWTVARPSFRSNSSLLWTQFNFGPLRTWKCFYSVSNYLVLNYIMRLISWSNWLRHSGLWNLTSLLSQKGMPS